MIPVMRKLRCYLDTSVISQWNAGDRRGGITREFFKTVHAKPDEYELIVSPVTLRELDATPDEKRSLLFAAMQRLSYIELPEQSESDNLAKLYVSEGVLSEKHINDLTHVAYAVLTEWDVVTEWDVNVSECAGFCALFFSANFALSSA